MEQWVTCAPAIPLYLNPYHFNQELRGVNLQPYYSFIRWHLQAFQISVFLPGLLAVIWILLTYFIHLALISSIMVRVIFTHKQSELCSVCTFSISLILCFLEQSVHTARNVRRGFKHYFLHCLFCCRFLIKKVKYILSSTEEMVINL